MSGCIHGLSTSHSPVFLLNSCLDLFSAPPSLEDPLSRSYRVSLPSSLTVNHPSALVYSTRPRVSVYGTGDCALQFSGFSRQHGYQRCRRIPEDLPYCRVSARQAAVSLLRLHVTRTVSNGILTVSSIGLASRLILRTRLTLGRLTLPRKPWSCGEGASHPLYRYLYLHLLFQTLQKGSRPAFSADWNAPLPIICDPTASVTGFIPDYYPCPAPRLVSCYALFE